MTSKYDNYLTKELLSDLMAKHKSANKIAQAEGIHLNYIIKYLDRFDIPRIKLTKYKKNEDFFAKDTEESFYLAGFIAADGCINQNLTMLTIDLSLKDADYLQTLIKLLMPNRPYRVGKSSNKLYDIARFTIYSKTIVSDLKRFNITPRKSLTYQFPIHLANHPLLKHFLRGYMDGDGCWKLHKKENMVTRVSLSVLGTYHLISNFKLALEINCNFVSKAAIRQPKNQKIHELEYGENQICATIYNYLYDGATIFLPRKKEIAEQANILKSSNPNIARYKYTT